MWRWSQRGFSPSCMHTHNTDGTPPSTTFHCLSFQGLSRWHASQSDILGCLENFSLPWRPHTCSRSGIPPSTYNKHSWHSSFHYLPLPFVPGLEPLARLPI